VEPPAEAPALARIATHLRRGDVLSSPEEREDGFDVKAILAAVREVDGVRDASLRTTPAGAHSLRLDLSEGADPAEVSRLVARLLQDTMGLDAAAMTGSDLPPGGVPTPRTGSSPLAAPSGGGPLSPGLLSSEALSSSPSAGSAPAGTAYVPSQPVPAGRAPGGSFATAGPPSNADVQDAPHPPGSVSGGLGAERRRVRASVDSQQGRAVGETTGSMPGSRAPHVGTVERVATDFEPAQPRPLIPGDRPGPRVIIENVQVNTFGIEATVEVRLTAGDRAASGVASGPAVDGYLLRLCATATAGAVDELLAFSDHVDGPARCFVEHAATVPFGASEVAVVVLLLSCGGWVEQLAGSSVVTGDDRHAMVRATLAAVNRRLEALLS
jgi:hypothetical protein